MRQAPGGAGWRRVSHWAWRVVLGIAALVVLAVAGGYLWLRGSLPQLEGEVELAALRAPAEILRDGDGVITIRAETETDAAIALGYAHAQDRLWQMDFSRRAGAGRVAEVVGPRALALDRFMRTLGLYRIAEANLAGLPPETRAMLEAYAAGVNAFLDGRRGPLPLEFQILRYAPEPWRPADSVVWGRLMALQLSDNWRDEILRARLAAHLDAEQIAFLWPAYPKDAPTTLKDLAAATRGLPLDRFAGLLPWELAPKDASNAWVVAGARTASGAPILAGDPHLALSAPGQWVLARIETPERTLLGATAPGLPFPVLGQNDDVAWAFTTTHSDTQDIFIERLAPGDPDAYETPDGARPFEVREEVIEVRGQAPETWRVRTTRHGPVISDAIAERLDELPDAGTVLALAWPGLRADDRTPAALHAMNRARSAADILAALRDLHSPQQTVVFADRAGHIGLAAPGRVPIRKQGDGRQPVPGWSGDFDWIGEIPFNELPQVIDPPSGAIVAANNKLVPDGYRHLLTADWRAPHRAARIEVLLNSDPPGGQTLENSAAIQLDLTSNAARELLPFLLAAKAASEHGALALKILRAWDGRMTREAAAPLIYHAWTGALTEALLADKLGPAFEAFRTPRTAILIRVLSDAPQWCDNVTTPAVEDCAAQLSASLDTALAGLARHYGASIEDWRWGAAHLARFEHPVLRHVPLAEAIFGFAQETPGDGQTVNRGGMSFAGDPARDFENIHGPGYRAIYDLADPANSRFMIATGQSGNPLSPWYGNLAARWRDGEYMKPVGGATAEQKRLRLTPH